MLTVSENMIFTILVRFRHADVPDAFADYNVDRCNTDASLPRRFYLLRRYVRHSFILLSSGTDRNGRPCSGNGVDNLPKDGRVPITKRISTISLSSNQMEVALYTSHEHSRSLAPQTGQRVPYVSSNVQLGDKLKPHGLNSDDDMESSAE
jgi:hypothetical protein